MKQYQITLEVPDEFDPEEDIINIQFGNEADVESISIVDEQFVSAEKYIERFEEIKKLIESNCDFKLDDLKDDSVIRIMFDPTDDVSNLQEVLTYVEMIYNRKCICLCNKLDVLVENADEAINMLNGMIAKIKVRSAVKDTSGIVLPN